MDLNRFHALTDFYNPPLNRGSKVSEDHITIRRAL